MFRQLSTTRTQGHTVGEEKGSGGGGQARARAPACLPLLTLAADVFQQDP